MQNPYGLSPLFFTFSRAIVRTIKDFEKGLHAVFPCPFSRPISFLSFAQSASSIFSLGPNDIAKWPHLEAHSAPSAMSFGPNDNSSVGWKSPLSGVGGLLRGVWGCQSGEVFKKGKHRSASLANAKIRIFRTKCKCAVNIVDKYLWLG